MKERPILFSGPMVRAILNGNKIQTRRVVKSHPAYRCPYGEVGDLLWVRETWGVAPGYDHLPPRDLMPHGMKVNYAADGSLSGCKLRPSIHMPRWASRITLEITEVRIELLQQISEADATAEGVQAIPYTGENAGPNRFTVDVAGGSLNAPTAVEAFRALWEYINGDGAWRENPWVWVVAFRLV